MTDAILTTHDVAARARRRHVAGVGLASLLAIAAVTGLAFRGARGDAPEIPRPDVPSAEGKAIVFSPAFAWPSPIIPCNPASRQVAKSPIRKSSRSGMAHEACRKNAP